MPKLLLADFGGTNVRFGLSDDGGRPTDVTAERIENFESPYHAIEAYLRLHALKTVDAVSACAAGPLIDDKIDFTNADWTIEREKLGAFAPVDACRLINDFAAMAYAVPRLAADERQVIGGARLKEVPPPPYAVLGPGTGLGVAGLILSSGGTYETITGEGGHAQLAPSTERESDILVRASTSGYVGAEDFLSGPGLVRLDATIRSLDGRPPLKGKKAEDIYTLATYGADPSAEEAVRLFTAWLGAFAGDLSLMLGARAVFLMGGILPQWQGTFDHELFRTRFDAKGKMRTYMGRIPVFLVTAQYPALLGLIQAATTP